ncbi:MAG: DUF2357 domain-containing protein, partial [Actinomycetota bacterium]|nr:DUF2357 domain-containing protein [Actinomycetota bacterium]
MEAIHDIALDLASDSGSIGVLHIACRGDAVEWKPGIQYLVDTDRDPDGHHVGQPVQLLEESEYVYRIEGTFDGPILLQPSEIFDPDDAKGISGRLRPGRFVGTVAVTAETEGTDEVGTAAFEVRSRKLDYLKDFQWMLNRIASEATDLLLSHFAPATVSLKPDGEESGTALYSRFALLRSLLESDEIESAIQLIINRPHSQYQTVTERI